MLLIVFGGYIELVYMKNYLDFEVIGEMRDDVVGEVYDKVVWIINFFYFGGLYIDWLVVKGKDVYDFLRVWFEKDSYDFSFSGFKSVVINKLYNLR